MDLERNGNLQIEDFFLNLWVWRWEDRKVRMTFILWRWDSGLFIFLSLYQGRKHTPHLKI